MSPPASRSSACSISERCAVTTSARRRRRVVAGDRFCGRRATAPCEAARRRARPAGSTDASEAAAAAAARRRADAERERTAAARRIADRTAGVERAATSRGEDGRRATATSRVSAAPAISASDARRVARPPRAFDRRATMAPVAAVCARPGGSFRAAVQSSERLRQRGAVREPGHRIGMDRAPDQLLPGGRERTAVGERWRRTRRGSDAGWSTSRARSARANTRRWPAVARPPAIRSGAA